MPVSAVVSVRYLMFCDTLVITSSDKTSVDTPRELLEGKTTQFYIGTEVLQDVLNLLFKY